ncbi:MAG: von Willebrand factor type A domain-containing protein, partial [Planctomycetota bacterium]|nr:von Willebrand factor type A domain-containing protein [Planctomycetota bacterium]
DEVLSQLDRRAGETPDMMFFRFWGDNPFVDTRTDGCLSTVAVDVDTASYTLMRNYLMSRRLLPPPEAVRTEEFVNYFPGGLEPPTGSAAFAVHTEVAPSPFAHESSYLLLKIGIKAREVAKEERKPCALVFVVDTSGSMRREDRLELVKDGLRLLVPELDEGDSVGIVAFDREARTVLEPTPASERERILDAVGTLHANQNTNVDAGLRLGYEMAARSYLQGANNRVILLSDGVANTGVTEAAQILERVRSQREKGIYLTCVGVGMGNHNDALLEQLADRGDGQCVYVDRREEARKVFVDNLTGTLEVIARDVKIQVTFDPKKVVRHRLLGYENRAMAHHLFRDNTVDAGEVGAGHEVVALYELKPAGDARGKLATVRLRYQTVEHNEAVEMEHDVDAGGARSRFEDTSPHFQLSALVAEFAEVLRDSYWARGNDLSRVASLTQALLGEGEGKLGTSKELVELVALMKKADALVRLRDSRTDERREVVDALKDVRYRSAVLDELGGRRDADRQHLDSLRRQNDDLRRRLEDVFRR